MTKITTGSFFFVALTTFSGFFIGMLLSRFLIPKDPGMLGGIVVLGNGVIGMALGFLLGIISWRFLNAPQLNVLNRIMGIFCLGFTLWLGYRIITNL